MKIPEHYNNDNGSLYKIAEQRGWNAYQFDAIKRLDRALKKGEFIQDLEKTKTVIDLWISEVDPDGKPAELYKNSGWGNPNIVIK